MEATTQIFLRVQVTDREDSAIEGEARVEGYSNQRMLIDSFTFGMKAKLQAPGLGDEEKHDNCQFDHVTVDKVFDRASTRLASLLKPDESKHPPLLSEVRITLDQQLIEDGQGFLQGSRKAQNAIMVFHLYKARVVEYRLNASEEKASAALKETVSFSFQNVAVEYCYKGDKKDMRNSDYRGSAQNADKSDYRDAWLVFDTNYSVQAEG